ncbi:hypothetical protein [Draconibacterium sediminis]|mgnify:CR=1 FL=1|uniref:hypothetical protein n=1 Tax=Draconibacterium sediminis TaxID=1544798 RepID=UPI0026F11D13|nr:hypothetical protein [Draconibacterium sediminis]
MKRLIKSEWFPLLLTLIFIVIYYLFGKNKYEGSDNVFQFIIGSGLVVWLIQKTIDSFLNKKFEAYKKELQIKSDEHRLKLDKDLKDYESKLNLFINKTSLLQQRRIDILSKLYKKLAFLYRTMFELTRLVKFVYEGEDGDETENQRIIDAGAAYNDFSEYFDNHKIYFSPEICELIVKLKKEFWESFHDYTFKSKFNLPPSEMTYQQAKDAAKKIDEDVPKILELIELEFRKLVGVIEE